jgi:hypothetical protein
VNICLKRQERAKSQSESVSFCESLIFCNNCPQGLQVQKFKSRKIEFDIISLRKDMVKGLIKRKEYKMLGIKKLGLKKKETKKIQLKRRN